MRALVLHDTTGPGALRLEQMDAPAAPDGTTAIDVHAAGIGFVDYLVTRGEYQIRPPLPFVPGIEVAGTTEGRRVAATVPFGAFAEVAVAPAFLVFDLPDEMTFTQGAAMVTNFQTAHLGLVRRGRLVAGEIVLVLGAAGGVGLASIGVAKALGAATVIAVVSSEQRGAVARAAGADEVRLLDEEWEREVTADVVVDPVGGDAFRRGLRCLAPGGRLLVVGFASGTIPQFEVNRLLLRSTDVVGVNYGGTLAVRPSRRRPGPTCGGGGPRACSACPASPNTRCRTFPACSRTSAGGGSPASPSPWCGDPARPRPLADPARHPDPSPAGRGGRTRRAVAGRRDRAPA